MNLACKKLLRWEWEMVPLASTSSIHSILNFRARIDKVGFHGDVNEIMTCQRSGIKLVPLVPWNLVRKATRALKLETQKTRSVAEQSMDWFCWEIRERNLQETMGFYMDLSPNLGVSTFNVQPHFFTQKPGKLAGCRSQSLGPNLGVWVCLMKIWHFQIRWFVTDFLIKIWYSNCY